MSDEKAQDRLDRIRERIKQFPAGPGLYFMKDGSDKVLYIGKAKSLRSRAGSYFQPSTDLVESRGPWIVEMVSQVETVDFIETANEVDAILQEARLIKDIRPPYNTDLADDKTFPYLEITTWDDFPGVYITRKPDAKSRLFGPFTSVKDLRQTLVVMQKIFKFRTCGLDIRKDDAKRRFFRPCLLYSIKQCAAPCGDRISHYDYKKIISDLLKFLRSKRSAVLRQLRGQMAEAARKMEYEKAAVLRDRLRLIEKLDERGTPDENVQPEVFVTDPSEALLKLQEIFGMPEPVRIIEGIDIAHISGSEAVGSLVKFIDGRPFKSGYRRFAIKGVTGVDDYAMIAEVVRRRYKYATAGEELWPDIILIDGGLGQLHAAECALKELFATENTERQSRKQNTKYEFLNLKQIPITETANSKQTDRTTDYDTENIGTNLRVVSLVKREEEIYRQGTSEPLRLARNNAALKLLQYVRDEAHRFAQHYHHILRSKKMLE
ncbi:MAG: excinuclease ABC subunit UvrC [Phycisphaerae bacterium]|nr:excinuclease ABC subunit UvrC [Phycisphaerae bacterium]